MWTLCLLTVTLVAVVRGYATGAGEAACDSMLPQHFTASPQMPTAPDFFLTTGATTYSSNEEITVRLNGAFPMKGFLIQARTLAGQRVGTFALGTDQDYRCNQVTGRGGR